jgi:hypothetical protein
MIAINIEKVQSVQAKFVAEIDEQRKLALSKLKKFKKSRVKLSPPENNYLDNIIQLFEVPNILTSTPEEISIIKAKIGSLPPNSRKKKLKPLKKFIIEKLNYTGLRKSFYPKYFNQIGIKSCVYCNASLTISIETPNKKISARFDVDHYEPKDSLPYLSVFLFNLYPACAPCNRRKSKSSILNFKLYSLDNLETKKSKYFFKLEPTAKCNYLLTKDVDDIKFSFEPKMNPFQLSFHIEELYSTQKDLIEELIVKQQMYDQYNLKNLKNNFSKLKLHPELYLRSIIGNYTKQTEIHKRPMAKFVQDIARDLGIID